MNNAQTISGAAQEFHDSTLKAIVRVLLTESKHRPQSSVEAVARVHTQNAGFYSVGRILKEMNASQEVVDFAIEICLQRTQNEHPALGGGDALSAACRWIAHGASEEVKNKVVMEVARQGMYGLIEDLTRKHLSRDLTEEEALLLVKACLDGKMMNSITGAGHLLVIAKRCLPKYEADAVAEKMRKSKEEFDFHLD